VKDLRTGRPGDEYLHIKVKTPTNLTKSEKDLLDEFRKQEDAKWWHNPFKRS
jgi:DnaJ-class molecular chaperone